METNIQQIVEELVEKILEGFKKTNLELNELCGELAEDCKCAARELTEAYAEELNRRQSIPMRRVRRL